MSRISEAFRTVTIPGSDSPPPELFPAAHQVVADSVDQGDVPNRWRRLFLVVGAVFLIGAPVGYAISRTAGEPSSTFQTAAECPTATSAQMALGLKSDYYVPNCPSERQLRSDIAQLTAVNPLVDQCQDAVDRGTATETCLMTLAREAEKSASIDACRQQVADGTASEGCVIVAEVAPKDDSAGK